MKLQGSGPSGRKTLQSQITQNPKNRLTFNRLAVVHGRQIMSMSVNAGAMQSYPQPPLALATDQMSPVGAPDIMSKLIQPQPVTSPASDQSGSTATVPPPPFSTDNLKMLLALQDQSSNGSDSTTDNSGLPADAPAPPVAPLGDLPTPSLPPLG